MCTDARASGGKIFCGPEVQGQHHLDTGLGVSCDHTGVHQLSDIGGCVQGTVSEGRRV